MMPMVYQSPAQTYLYQKDTIAPNSHAFFVDGFFTSFPDMTHIHTPHVAYFFQVLKDAFIEQCTKKPITVTF